MTSEPRHRNLIPMHWQILCVATIGVMISYGPLIAYTLGIFLKPLIEEFAWQRGPASLVLTIYALTIAFLLPVVGNLVDRAGARKVIIPALALFGIGIALLSKLPGNLSLWYLSFFLLAFVSAGCGPLAYAKVVTTWFERRRGFALGIMVAGGGAGAAIFPVLVQKLIDTGGWRLAYLGLACIVMLITFPLVTVFLRNSPYDLGLQPEGTLPKEKSNVQKAPDYGSTVRDALHASTFWILAAAYTLPAMAIMGMTMHLPALLTDRGLTPQMAAASMGLMGVSSIVGHILVGWLLDRFFAPRLTIVFFIAPCLASLLLAFGASGTAGFLCAVLVGLGVGAEVDMIAYITIRYFGHKHFTEIYGYQFAFFSLGASIGPIVMGFGFDYTGSYTIPLYISAFAVFVACGLLTLIGPYPDWLVNNKQSSS